MKILHISDTHGIIRDYSHLKYDCVVHSGDFLPNSNKFGYVRFDNVSEAIYQLDWLKNNIQAIIHAWQLKDKPFVFTLGNHDFCKIESVLNIFKDNQVDAYAVDCSQETVKNIIFAGMPYVPPISGRWNFETEDENMKRYTDILCQLQMEKPADIWVMHSPVHQILDEKPQYGSSIIKDGLFSLPTKKRPQYYLHGHTHFDSGTHEEIGIVFVNSALTYHIIEI